MNFKRNKLVIAMALLLGSVHGLTFADETVRDIANVVITGNTDNSNNSEGVFIYSTSTPSNVNYNGASLRVTSQGNSNPRVDITGVTGINGATTITGPTSINNQLNVTGRANVGGALDVTGASTLSNSLTVTGPSTLSSSLTVNGPSTISNTLSVSGASTLSNTLSVSGATSINNTLSVSGMSTTTGITNTVSLSNNGSFDQSGQTTINGLTTINGVGSASTVIGNNTNLAGSTTIRSGSSSLVVSQGGTAISATGSNEVTGAENSITATNGGNTISATGSNTVTGATNSISATGSNTVTGATNSISATGSNTVTGATNSISATGSNTVTGASNMIEALAPNGSNEIRALGPNASNVIVGTTNVNVSADFASNINTGVSAGNVTVGNELNVTRLNSSENYIGVADNYETINKIGTGPATGAFSSINEIGNRNLASKVTALAGNSSLSLMNNNASLTVPNRTSNANGLDVNQSSSVMTGGSSDPTRLALTDNIATFSRAATGAPITVTGVANGRNDFDAVNVRQFASAIAATAAMGNVPQLAAGMDRSIGLGFGNYMGKTGLAFGMNLRSSNVAYRLSVSSGLNDGAKAVVAGGASWSW